MDLLVDLLEYDLPLWVVLILNFLLGIGKVWAGVRRFISFVGSTNRRLKEGVRQWLGVRETVVLTQEEYDRLPQKDSNVMYMVTEEPGKNPPRSS